MRAKPDDFSAHVVVVTGGAGGQGAEEARAFAARGARVVVADVRAAEAGEVAAALGERALAVHLDVADERSWADAVATAEARFGPVTTLVNNAGVGSPAALADESLESFRRVLDVNLVGTFLGMKAVAPSMERAGGGSIVNISSISGLGGFAGGGAYAASKWAIRGLTRTAAADLAPLGIRVNAVAPGVTDTPMIRGAGTPAEAVVERNSARLLLQRLASPGDIASVVLFLASPRSSYITGADFVVDGGWSTGNAGRKPA
jgi:3alpha(or 20beta)-hydroxysteroid dehydrogenase